MPPKESKQTPSNTVCSKGSQAGWGTDGKVHCFNSVSNNSFGLIFTIDLIIIVLGFNLVFNYVMACSIDAGSVNNTK